MTYCVVILIHAGKAGAMRVSNVVNYADATWPCIACISNHNGATEDLFHRVDSILAS
jgi:hypothetical protein